MKTLVIHPKDSTTDFLKEIYINKNWTVIDTNTSKKILTNQIKTHDRIIMLGHGTEYGLIGFNRLIIDSNLVYLLREKICVCIWCNADVFVKKYNLKGLFTGMIISELQEAEMYSIQTNSYWINESNIDFAIALRDSIDSDNILDNILLLYEGNSSVVDFNIKNIYYK